MDNERKRIAWKPHRAATVLYVRLKLNNPGLRGALKEIKLSMESFSG